MKVLFLILVVLIVPNLGLASGSYFLDLGLSGVFFRAGAGIVDTLGSFTEFDFRAGVLPFFPFAVGVDGVFQFRYGPILWNLYMLDIEPISSYSSGTRIFGFTSGISFVSPISERFKLWGGIQIYSYVRISFGDSIRTNVQVLRELECIKFSSFFCENDGVMRIGFSYRFRSATFFFDLFRAYTRAKFSKVFMRKEEWGFTKYPYLVIGVKLPFAGLED